MNRIAMLLVVGCFGMVFAASTCFAQMYTVTDLGTLRGTTYSEAVAINASGQIAGTAINSSVGSARAFRTMPNSPITDADDIGGLPPCTPYLHFDCAIWEAAYDMNDSGQVVGTVYIPMDQFAFRTDPNGAFMTFGEGTGTAAAINASGQVVWNFLGAMSCYITAPNSDQIYSLGQFSGCSGTDVNDSGQVVGWLVNYPYPIHAFRTAPNSPINLTTDDLGTLGGETFATRINAFGQVVGLSYISDFSSHAFRTAANSRINPATDDLGAGWATSIDNYGQVVGIASTQHPFLYSSGVKHDLNSLIAAGFCELVDFPPVGDVTSLRAAPDINDAGQIAANGICNGQYHAVRLDPIYKAFVQRPIKADGSSIFSAKRGVVPVKFTLAEYNMPTCNLRPATIAITRATSDTLAVVDESSYSSPADNGSNFRIDANCQYIYNLATSALGAGMYRVDISINGIMVGHAVFALK